MHTIIDIFTAPAEAMRTLREKPSFMLPLTLLIVANVAVALWYYNVVDVPWMLETSLENTLVEMPADQREAARERIAGTSRAFLAGSSAAGGAIVVVVILLLAASYLTIVSMFTNDGFRFRQWFSLTAWSSLPTLLALIASMVMLLAVEDPAHLPPQELNPLAFSNLLGLEAGRGVTGGLLQYLAPTSIWALGLMIYGYSRFTGKAIEIAALIVAAPLIVLVTVGVALS